MSEGGKEDKKNGLTLYAWLSTMVGMPVQTVVIVEGAMHVLQAESPHTGALPLQVHAGRPTEEMAQVCAQPAVAQVAACTHVVPFRMYPIWHEHAEVPGPV